MIKKAKRDYTKKLALTAMFTTLIIVGAFIKIPIPYIPFTLQVFFVNMAMLMLGAKWGGMAVGIYIAMGLIGIPIFTAGGGWSYVFHPTFGYLIGFFIGTIVGGNLMRLFKNGYFGMAVASIVFEIITYICGLSYFYFIQSAYLGVSVTAKTVFISCFLIFLPGDTISCVLGAIIVKRLSKFRLISFKKQRVLEPPEIIETSHTEMTNTETVDNAEIVEEVVSDIVNNSALTIEQSLKIENSNIAEISESENSCN